MNCGLLDFQNEGQQFSLENKGLAVAEKIHDETFNRESDVNDILGLSTLDLHGN